MSENVIKFGKAKKSIARAKKDAQAIENRAKFGRTKTEKLRDKMKAEKLSAHLSAHKRDSDTPSS